MSENIKENHSNNFIHQMIDRDLEEKKYNEKIHTRFPPEPNGYLHIGHAKAICINFETAKKYQGLCNLRFDDTNPVKEETEFVEAIKEDIQWLGYKWDGLFFASDYFEKMYEFAIRLINKGLAYVDDLTPEEIREYRGDFTTPGRPSPFRDRPAEESIDLFARMKKGEFPDGSRVLRAKIDYNSPNLNMRDPVIYRISHNHHHRTKDEWCIYPMYDYAHPIEDALEGISHSLCSLEFEDHRPLYDWILREIAEWVEPPRQIEFARLNLTKTLMSKRYLRDLVEEKQVSGWDDPRMPTLSGLRRRGFTPESIKNFANSVGVSKSNSLVDIEMLEHFVRDDLKLKAKRKMAVLNPLKVVITNYPEGEIEYVESENNPEVPEMGKRQIPFGREIYVEREDFMENPPKKYYRLFPGNEVRLRHAYFIKCNEVIKDEEGNVIELRCTYDQETKSGLGFTARKVKGTLHWVHATENIPAKVRLYDYLMKDTEEGSQEFNEDSLEVVNSFLEKSFEESKPGDQFQFLRHGYFCEDIKDSSEELKVFNRVVSLKSSWKKK